MVAIDRSYEAQSRCSLASVSLITSNSLMRIKRYLIGARLSKIALFFLLLFLILNYAVNHFFTSISHGSSFSMPPSDSSFRLRELKQKHITDLNRIKRSVSIELRELESKRNKIQEDISIHQGRLTTYEQSAKKAQNELAILKRQIVQLKNEQLEAAKPKMAAPAKLVASEADNIVLPPPTKYQRCRMHNCFDYSRCSLVSQFPVYLYPPSESSLFPATPYILGAAKAVLSSNAYITSDPNTACLYLVVLGEVEAGEGADANTGISGPEVTAYLASLDHWHGDGRNHMLVYLSRKSTTQNPLLDADTGRAIVAQSNFGSMQFRPAFDIVMPTLALPYQGASHHTSEQEVDHAEQDGWMDEGKESWFDDSIPVQVPALRQYILFFQGQFNPPANLQASEFNSEGGQQPKSAYHELFLETLRKLSQSTIHGKYLIQTKCPDDRVLTPGFGGEWSLCGSFVSRSTHLARSTFTLVPAPEHSNSLAATSIVVTRIVEALRSGSVPVLLGNHAALPLADFIEWEKALVIVPQARITELSFLLLNFPHAEILSLRRQGRFLFDSFLSSPRSVLDSMLAVVRTRLQIPPLPVLDRPSNVIEHESYKLEGREPAPGDAQLEFGMPPPEATLDSQRFQRNFTMVTLDARSSWNAIPGPFSLYPNLPSDRLLPTDAQFIGSTEGFRPVGQGEGGTGRVYQESLGGNSPREQFTIVMLTYEREEVLIQAIERLAGLPFLHKVVVVWNSPTAPGSDLRWPELDVEVAVIHPKRNSLNNRFVPWDEIKTEAVLSIDDDAHLRHDEILFGFRVWRENRERIVGFPGRFHAWDPKSGSWNYNSNHTCELSMVLTGAAFLHKHYMHLYTDWMPSVVRDVVDEFMNCEDIAINFLVSHVIRKPPVKVTSRWTFRCPGCPVALSQSQEHFDERHKCINRFVKIFGYMPLLFTQYRVDSVLFKTRLPHDKQKCFKFI